MSAEDEIEVEELPVDPPRFRVLTLSQVFDLCPPEYLVEGVLTQGESALLYGASNAGKSFVVLSLALSVATGEPWFGHPVKQGSALYVLAEGFHGLRYRAQAWAQDKSVDDLAPSFFVVGEAVNFRSPKEVQDLLSVLEKRRIRPRLVVVDPLARCMAGGDENSSKDMGEFVAGCDALRVRFGATVLVVHHTGKAGDRERGSTALRGAMDSVFRLSRTRRVLDLFWEKKRDEALRDPLRFQLEVVPVEGRTTCRLLGSEEADSHPILNDSDCSLLQILTHKFSGEETPKAAVRKAFPGADASFYRALVRCQTAGYVIESEPHGQPQLVITAAGTRALLSRVSGPLTPSHENGPSESHPSSPPLRGETETGAESGPGRDSTTATRESKPQQGKAAAGKGGRP